MTLSGLKQRYHELSISSNYKDKMKSKGFLEIIKLYMSDKNINDTEPVKISLIAEKYIKTQNNLYSILKKEEYRQKVQAGMECIIKYASSDEIARIIASISLDDGSISNYVNYLKGVGYMDRIKYSDLVSAHNLLLL